MQYYPSLKLEKYFQNKYRFRIIKNILKILQFYFYLKSSKMNFITIDGDGQNNPEDIPKLISEAIIHVKTINCWWNKI